ncbi:MAG: ISL3 family transposase [Chloroflexota bacterium]
MLPLTEDLPVSISLIAVERAHVVLYAHGVASAARCPACGALSSRVHDRYRRRPLDQPWRGWTVRLQLTVRRFTCGNAACRRRTFVEDFGPTLRRRAQRTAACTRLLTTIACALGGEAGARLARATGVPSSPDTLLRLERQIAEPDFPTPRVLGVDDFALRRRHRYGTILVDLQRHRPIDLLEGREADTLAAWLRQHPGVEIIVRDRAEAYAEGARQGAPDAVQIADRFHLLQNATTALLEVAQSHKRRIALEEAAADQATPPEATDAPPPVPPPRISQAEQVQRERRVRWLGRWGDVQRRHTAGESLRQIARETGMHRRTVRRLLELPEPVATRKAAAPRPSGLSSPTLQPFVSYLQDRWQAGCSNILQLYRELLAQGYTGSRSLLYTALQAWRPPNQEQAQRQQQRRVRRRVSVRSLCVRLPDRLDASERAALDTLLAQTPDLATGHALVQRFRAVLKEHSLAGLDGWLANARASGLRSFVSLAAGIEADRAAVEAAITGVWSTGPVEGHNHRLKLIKRRGYGRASFGLLRRRVLVA